MLGGPTKLVSRNAFETISNLGSDLKPSESSAARFLPDRKQCFKLNLLCDLADSTTILLNVSNLSTILLGSAKSEQKRR